MPWDEHYDRWNVALSDHRNAEASELLQAARKLVGRDKNEDWIWLEASLNDPTKKWFVARLFAHQPIPRRLFAAMVRAAVIDVDASSNKWLIKPCLETFGRNTVLAELKRLLKEGIATEQRFEQATYWLRDDVDFARGCCPVSDP